MVRGVLYVLCCTCYYLCREVFQCSLPTVVYPRACLAEAWLCASLCRTVVIEHVVAVCPQVSLPGREGYQLDWDALMAESPSAFVESALVRDAPVPQLATSKRGQL